MRGFLGWVFECVARVHGKIITRPGICLGARQEWLLPSQTKPEEGDSSGRQEAPGATSARLPAFSHPDCTVGPGIAPGHAPEALAGCTAGRDLGPAALTLPRRRGFQLANSTPVRRNPGRWGSMRKARDCPRLASRGGRGISNTPRCAAGNSLRPCPDCQGGFARRLPGRLLSEMPPRSVALRLVSGRFSEPIDSLEGRAGSEVSQR